MSAQDYIESFGKPPAIVDACNDLNASLTKWLDALLGTDAVDAFDASCNTCSFFRRAPMTAEEKKERNLFGMPGRCAKKDIATRGWQRGQYCAFENGACYENRRTGRRPDDSQRNTSPRRAKEGETR